ncbi:hypothetical protein RUND412_001912 [Rhizina undulata]
MEVPSIVLSIFAIVILSVIGLLFDRGHETMMGSTEDPTDGKAVAGTIFTAVGVYGVCPPPILPLLGFPKFPVVCRERAWKENGISANSGKQFLKVFLVFCSGQAWLHRSQRSVQL